MVGVCFQVNLLVVGPWLNHCTTHSHTTTQGQDNVFGLNAPHHPKQQAEANNFAFLDKDKLAH